MQFKIEFIEGLEPSLYDDYAEFILSEVESEIDRLVEKNSERYESRESLVLESSIISWNSDPPKRIDLMRYVRDCLELVRVKGDYIIRLDPYTVIPRSSTPVSTLIRVLEYGVSGLPELPLVRRVLNYYRTEYKNLFTEFMEERFGL